MTGAAVFACFNPSDELYESCRRVIAQGVEAVVVDDCSPTDRSDLYAKVRQLGAEVIQLEQNSGIGVALNRGMEHVFDQGAEFVITLDQDTILCDDYVSRIRETMDRIGSAGPVLLTFEDINGYEPGDLGSRGGLRVSFEPMQSGMVVSAQAYEAVGPLDGDLFIDCVDVEYYLRARKLGVDTIIMPGAKIIHEIGYEIERRAPRILSPRRKTYVLREHAPFRLYYIVRNRARMIARYGRMYPDWLKGSLPPLSKMLFNEIVLPPDTWPRLYLALRGLYGAARGEEGLIPDAVLARAERIEQIARPRKINRLGRRKG